MDEVTTPIKPPAPQKNPQAFPRNGHPKLGDYPEVGMTLREWYAGKALVGELSSQSQELGEWTEKHYEDLAKRCYSMADAMLLAREIKE